ncbi:MAG: hypothetical protein EOP86_05635 [Verrucomicrobiaceae bacterium]|nr:MAG: hypothetical protein EOP86_05635 [Verrucomicrobiaceae bacterium]
MEELEPGRIYRKVWPDRSALEKVDKIRNGLKRYVKWIPTGILKAPMRNFRNIHCKIIHAIVDAIVLPEAVGRADGQVRPAILFLSHFVNGPNHDRIKLRAPEVPGKPADQLPGAFPGHTVKSPYPNNACDANPQPERSHGCGSRRKVRRRANKPAHSTRNQNCQNQPAKRWDWLIPQK